MSNKKDLVNKLFKSAKEQGIAEMEAYVSEGESFEVKIFKGEIDGYKLADSKGLGFRGFYNNKIGYSYTEKLSEDSIDILIKQVKENASINDNKDDDIIFEGSKEYTAVDSFNSQLEKVSVVDKIQFAKDMESIALSLDDRVKACQYCSMGSGKGASMLMNSQNLELTEKGNNAYAFVMVIVGKDDDLHSGHDYMIGNDFSKFNAEEIARNAVKFGLDLLGAKSMKSGEYPVIIDSRTSASLLSSITSIFSARAVQKNLSLLKGKIGQKVASDCVTIVDDPFLRAGTGSSSFDGEGVATKFKEVIKGGQLTTYLYNLKTAKKDGVESTGNASRGSYKSTIGISPTNMYIGAGDNSLDVLKKDMKDGLYIVSLEGMHSGFNTISGDFSLPATGFLVENGEISRPVKQITLSGNYYSLLKNIKAVGNDLRFTAGGNIGSPSILVEGLSVAGE